MSNARIKPTEVGYEFLTNVPLDKLAAYLTKTKRTILQVRHAYDSKNIELPNTVAVYGCNRLEYGSKARGDF